LHPIISHENWYAGDVYDVAYDFGSLVTPRIILSKKAFTLYVEDDVMWFILREE
jgi:hypothetical protein